MPELSLRNKAVNGVGWSFADNILNQGITFVVGLVLARLLSPNEYGLIGIITIFIAVFNAIVDSGFSSALIRKTECSEDDYNTMFVVNLVLSVVLFVILFICAPLIAMFFERQELVALSRVMGVLVIINALSITQYTILSKRLDFKIKTKASFIAAVTSGIVGISMAYLGYGVWALVGQQLTKQIIYSFLLWLFNKWIPKLSFNLQSFKYMWSFGWKLLVSGLIDTIWKEIYQVVIGKYYAPAMLGQFTRAKQFSEICSSNLTSVVQRVSYPSLSAIQNDKERLKQAYRKVIKVTMFVTFVLMLGLAAVSKSLILVLIGEQWLIAAGFLPILCFQMMLYPLHAINLNMLQVQGRSDLFLKLEIIKKFISVVPIILGIFVNIYWMLWGSVVTGFICYYLNAYYSGQMIDYPIIEQIKDISFSFILSAIMAVVVFCISFLQLPILLLLLIQIVIGGGIVFAFCELFHVEEYKEIKEIVIKIVK